MGGGIPKADILLRRRDSAFRFKAREQARRIRRLTVAQSIEGIIALFGMPWPSKRLRRATFVKKPMVMD